MAIGDQVRRIANEDMLVFDSSGNVIGIRSGRSSGEEGRMLSPDDWDSVQALVSGARNYALPAGLGWDSATWPLSISTTSDGRGSVGLTLRQALTIAHPTWESWTKYYVDVSQVTNGTGTEASPFNAIWRAVAAANTAGQPAQVWCKGGTTATANSNFSGGGATLPATDLVYIAYSGRAVVNTSNTTALSWTADGTYTNCYGVTRTNVMSVHDLTRRTDRGCYPRLKKVATQALCDRLPWTWWTDGTAVLVNRGDGAAVTDSNTRIYLSSGLIIQLSTTQYTMVLLRHSTSDGWDLEGGGPNGAIVIAYNGNVGSRTVVVGAEYATMRYSGNGASANSNFSCNGVNGLVMLDSCDASDGVNDMIGIHQSYATGAVTNFMTVNCTGAGSGIDGGRTSCNGWTTHEGVIAISNSDRFTFARGATMHSIDTTKSMIIEPQLGFSEGDIAAGGNIAPADVRVDGGTVWLLNPVWLSGNSGRPRVVVGTGGTLYYRGVSPADIQCAVGGAETATPYVE